MAGAVFGEVGGSALRDILGDSRSAKCCIFQYKIVSRIGWVRSPKRRVRADNFILGLSSDIVESSFYWQKHFRHFHLKSTPNVKFPVRWPAGIDVMLIFDVSLVCLWYLAGPRCFGQVVPTETSARCGMQGWHSTNQEKQAKVGILHPSPNRASVRRFTSVYRGALSKAFCFTCVSHLSIFRFLRGKQSLLPTASSHW